MNPKFITILMQKSGQLWINIVAVLEELKASVDMNLNCLLTGFHYSRSHSQKSNDL